MEKACRALLLRRRKEALHCMGWSAGSKGFTVMKELG
jgi:hypothetical protein